LPDDLGHHLVAGDGVFVFAAALSINLRAGEPSIRADMRLPEAVRMMQAAEDGEVALVLRQRLE